ncbi:MAG TPA: ribbon-helix-helix domain-containing protein [Kofleriaceae bacterium]|nr:ribbon-helix-helix domain-containing protein [Kofleriaceae bacterium]
MHARTKVPVAEYIRQGIDLALAKYRDHLPGQVDLELVEQPLPAVAPPRVAGRGRRR